MQLHAWGREARSFRVNHIRRFASSGYTDDTACSSLGSLKMPSTNGRICLCHLNGRGFWCPVRGLRLELIYAAARSLAAAKIAPISDCHASMNGTPAPRLRRQLIKRRQANSKMADFPPCEMLHRPAIQQKRVGRPPSTYYSDRCHFRRIKQYAGFLALAFETLHDIFTRAYARWRL